MDVIAHALWSNLAAELVARKRKRPLTKPERVGALVGGMAPDLVAFVPYLLASVVSGGGLLSYAAFRFHQEWLAPTTTDLITASAPLIPDLVHTVYSYTHSGLLWCVVALVLYLALKRLPLWWLGWGTHIALDVFTHDADHFPTKLLYPFSDFHINATSWSNPVVFGCTYVALLLCYLAVYTRRRRTA